MLFFQFSNDFKLIEYFFGMWGIFQFVREILTGPMLIVLAVSPQTRGRYLVDQAIERYPNVGLVLSVTESKLSTREYR